MNPHLENLFSSFHHDLRSAMAVLVGHAEHLIEKKAGPLTPEQEDSVEAILLNSRRVALMADNLAQALREGGPLPVSKEPVDLRELAERSVRSFALRAKEEGIELNLRCEGEDLWVLGSETLLGRLLDNLVSNALKYTQKKGEVTVSLVADKDSLTLAVEDTGIGIAPEELPRVFDRSYRTSEGKAQSPEGLGLGLFICKEIAEAHGARIEAKSTLGRGSSFRVVFPD